MEGICFFFYTAVRNSETGGHQMSLLEAKGIKKTYRTRFGGVTVEALKNVSFSVAKGE